MTTTTTTPANGPERFPRYCAVCRSGFWDGYLCEDMGYAYCGLECAAVHNWMTLEQLNASMDAWEAAGFTTETEPCVFWTDWYGLDLEDYDDIPNADDDPHAEFTDDGAYYPDVATAELVADSPSGRVSVDADDSDACQLLASIGITLAKGSR